MPIVLRQQEELWRLNLKGPKFKTDIPAMLNLILDRKAAVRTDAGNNTSALG